MILPAQTIVAESPVYPLEPRTKFNGMTYGLGPAGYDVRIDQDVTLYPITLENLTINALHRRFPRSFKKRPSFILASTMERFRVNSSVRAAVEDKSTFARLGVQSMNTNIEPGWEGYLTLELKNHGEEIIHIPRGSPIVQIVFMRLEAPTVIPYSGKYMHQVAAPVPALLER